MLFLFSVLFTNKAYSFDEYEHIWLGNTALELALDFYLQEDIYSDLNDEIREKFEKVTYGEIVSRVDYWLHPETIIERSRFSENPIRGYPTCPEEIWEKLHPTCVEEILASHYNQTHFQMDLLSSLDFWHKKSLSIANENIYSALLFNAISDHYLHDFFSPGHITTDRKKLNDRISLGIHDHTNNMIRVLPGHEPGHSFVLNNEHWSGGTELRNILRYLKKKMPEYLDGDKKNRAKYETYGHRRLFQQINQHNTIEVFEERLTRLENSSKKEIVTVFGDGFLLKERSHEQLLLMLLVQTLSIGDVLEARKNTKKARSPSNRYGAEHENSLQRVRNSFNEYRWHEKEDSVEIGIPYGYHDIGKEHFNDFVSVLIFNASYENLIGEEQANRFAGSIEFIPDRLPLIPGVFCCS